MGQCLSPYKSLLFFRDYLDGEWDISDKSYNMVYDKNGYRDWETKQKLQRLWENLVRGT